MVSSDRWIPLTKGVFPGCVGYCPLEICVDRIPDILLIKQHMQPNFNDIVRSVFHLNFMWYHTKDT